MMPSRFRLGLVDESRKMVTVLEILDATHFRGAWRGQCYEVRVIPDSGGMTIGDEVVCHALPGNSELVVIQYAGRVFLAGDAGVVDTPWCLYTDNIAAPVPTWVDITGVLTAVGAGRTQKFIIDPWNDNRGWYLTEANVEYNGGLTTGGAWNVMFNRAAFIALTGHPALDYKHIDIQGTLRPGGDGAVCVLLQVQHRDGGAGWYEAWVARTTDFGVTWAVSIVIPLPGLFSYWGGNHVDDLLMAQHGNDVWVTGWNDAFIPAGRIFRSNDGGATWDGGTVVLLWLECAPWAPIFCHQPIADVTDQIIWESGAMAGLPANIKKSGNAGAGWVNWWMALGKR